jgi:hypothetical protein
VGARWGRLVSLLFLSCINVGNEAVLCSSKMYLSPGHAFFFFLFCITARNDCVLFSRIQYPTSLDKLRPVQNSSSTPSQVVGRPLSQINAVSSYSARAILGGLRCAVQPQVDGSMWCLISGRAGAAVACGALGGVIMCDAAGRYAAAVS